LKKLTPIIQWFILLSAILLPFLVVRFFPKLQHTTDLHTFGEWSKAWEKDWTMVYVNCESCNYPFIGTLLSGGVMSTIDFENTARINNRFRYYLAIVDGINVLAIWFILTSLQVKRAPLWAGVIGLLPTSWIGSSAWGQIDGVGQFFILLFFIVLIFLNTKPTTLKRYLLLAAAGALLSLMLLTKQLIYFSMAVLGLILLVNLFQGVRTRKDLVPSMLTVALAFILPILFIDANLQLPAPYISHIQYILATGSQHGDIISSLGFNIWVFFSDNLLDSSHLPLQIGFLSLAPLSPYVTGLSLFFALNITLFFLFLRDLRHHTTSDQVGFNKDQLISALIYFSLVNLGFNLTLTGTHERYLYHFYPFVIMACLAWLARADKRVLLFSLFAGSLFYGAFLYGYLALMIRPLNLIAIRLGTFIHLVLFVFILYSWIRNSNSQAVSPSRT